MEDRKDLTVPMPAKLNDAIEGQLGYNDSKAAWIREACRQRLKREGVSVEGAEEGATS